jgi:hypothetical protein
VKVDFWNSAQVSICSKLVFTSADFHRISCAKFYRILRNGHGHGTKIAGTSEVLQKINGKRKNEAHTIFLNPFTVCSSFKRKFVICRLFTKKQTQDKFANGLNRLNGHAHLCLSVILFRTGYTYRTDCIMLVFYFQTKKMC